jgi:hypothetical protein
MLGIHGILSPVEILAYQFRPRPEGSAAFKGYHAGYLRIVPFTGQGQDHEHDFPQPLYALQSMEYDITIS